jgi:hypothetical protein
MSVRFWHGFVLLILVWGGTGLAGPLEDGRAAYLKNDYPAAYDAFSKAFRENTDSADAAIGVGLAARALGLYDRSQFALEYALNLDPTGHGARLELARTYMAMGLTDLARQEYRLLLDSEPPETIRAQIEQEMDRAMQLGSRMFWSGRATVEGLYDSNVRFGPSSDFVDTQLGALRVSGDSKPKEAFGAAFSMAEDGLYDGGVPGGWAGIAGAGAYVETLSGASEYAAQDFTAYGGLRLGAANRLLDLPLKGRYFMMDWDRLVTIGGVRPAFAWMPNEAWGLYTTVTLEDRDFDDDLRDSFYASVNQTVRRLIGEAAGNGVYVSAGAFREDADLGGYDNDGWECVLGGDKTLPWSLTGSVSLAFLWMRYDDVLFPFLQDEAREDDQWRGTVALAKPVSDRCTATLAWSYEETESNFDLYSYQRHEVRLGATVWF